LTSFSSIDIYLEIHSFPTRRSSDLQNDKFKLDQIRLKRYQNFSESLKLPFENKDQLLTDIFEAMQTRKFQSKVIVEKVYLWYNYGQAQLGGQNKSERSEEHTSELQSRENLVCRLLLEKKKERKPK